MEYTKKEKEHCVCLNIYVKCDNSKKDSYDDDSCKKADKKEERENCCIEINVFAECDKKDCKPYSHKEY